MPRAVWSSRAASRRKPLSRSCAGGCAISPTMSTPDRPSLHVHLTPTKPNLHSIPVGCPAHSLHVCKRYVGEYVSCSSCKSPNTILDKQNRLYFMQVLQCADVCGTRRSLVSHISIARPSAERSSAFAPARLSVCDTHLVAAERVLHSRSRSATIAALADP